MELVRFPPPYAVVKQDYAHLEGPLPEDTYHVTIMPSYVIVSQSEESSLLRPLLVLDLANAEIACCTTNTIDIMLTHEPMPPMTEWVIEQEDERSLTCTETIICGGSSNPLFSTHAPVPLDSCSAVTDPCETSAILSCETPGARSDSGLPRAVSNSKFVSRMWGPSQGLNRTENRMLFPSLAKVTPSSAHMCLRLRVSPHALPEWHCILTACAASAHGAALSPPSHTGARQVSLPHAVVALPSMISHISTHMLTALRASLLAHVQERRMRVMYLQALLDDTRVVRSIASAVRCCARVLPGEFLESPAGATDSQVNCLRTVLPCAGMSPSGGGADMGSVWCAGGAVEGYCSEDKVARLTGVVSGACSANGQMSTAAAAAVPSRLAALLLACVRMGSVLERARDDAVVHSVSVAIDSIQTH